MKRFCLAVACFLMVVEGVGAQCFRPGFRLVVPAPLPVVQIVRPVPVQVAPVAVPIQVQSPAPVVVVSVPRPGLFWRLFGR